MNQLFLTYNVHNGKWIVEQDYFNNIANVLILKGFKTDLASIPRFLWCFMASFELSKAAPLVHDFLYRNNIGTRKQADKYFLSIMKHEGVKFWKRRTAYIAVRIFAGIVWRKHEKK